MCEVVKVSRILRPSLRSLIGRKELVGVEIGVFLGLHSLTILNKLDIKRLYLVDPYTISPSYYSPITSCYETLPAKDIKESVHITLSPYKDKIVWVEDVETCHIEDELDFVYTDGDHTYKGVIKDLTMYYRLIKEGGIIGGHDFDEETDGNQVRRAVYDFFDTLKKEVHYDFDPYDSRTRDWWVFK